MSMFKKRGSTATPSLRDPGELGDRNKVDEKIVNAAIQGDVRTLESLVKGKRKRYTNLHSPDGLGRIALIEACRKNRKECVQILAEADSAIEGIYDADGKTALHVAARLGHVQCVVNLLKKDVSHSAVDRAGLTAVHDAAIHGQTQVLQTLIAYGADLGTITSDGETALILATRNGHTEATGILVRSDVDVNDVSTTAKKTALMFACEQGLVSIVDILLKRGAKFNLKDSSGCTAMEYCVRGGHKACAALLPDTADYGNLPRPALSNSSTLSGADSKALEGKLQQDLDRANVALHSATAELVTTKAELSEALAKITVLEAQIEAFRADNSSGGDDGSDDDDINFDSDDGDPLSESALPSAPTQSEKEILKLRKQLKDEKRHKEELQDQLDLKAGDVVPLSLYNQIVEDNRTKINFYREMLILARKGVLPEAVARDLDAVVAADDSIES